MVLTLFVITAVAAAALGFVYYFTKEPIEKVKENKLKQALAQVLPAFEKQVTDTIDGSAVYSAFDANNQLIGIAVESEADGFGGKIKLLVGFDNSGKIFGYSVLSHKETAGLGSKMGTWFQADGKGNVIGKDLANGAKVVKDGGDIDAITASTISSRAFCEGLNKAYATYVLAAEKSTVAPEKEEPTVEPAAEVSVENDTVTAVDSLENNQQQNEEGGNENE